MTEPTQTKIFLLLSIKVFANPRVVGLSQTHLCLDMQDGCFLTQEGPFHIWHKEKKKKNNSRFPDFLAGFL